MGGTERIAIGLAKAWVEAGRDVTIICGTEAGPQRASVDGRIKVVQLDPPIMRSPLSRFRLGHEMGKMLAALAPDVIFLPGNFHLFLANNLRKADPYPAIVLKVSNPPLPRGFGAPVARTIFRRFARGVDALAPMNAGLTTVLRELLPDKIITALNDPIFVNANVPQRRARARGVPHSILWAGRLEPQKDVPLALETLKALLRHTPAHLTLLGDGTLHSDTTNHIARLGLEAHVTRTGHVARIEPFMAEADALLITSHYEGGPAVAAEALALGVPVVSTDCSSFLHDILTRPYAGEIVESRNPDDLARALYVTIQRGRPPPATLAALVAHLEPRACARAYLDWFDAIVTQRAISADRQADRAPHRCDSATRADNPSPAPPEPARGWQG
ncbi:glycosyltransferase [Sphingomonas bacterium]|uniref:glycosyltransferase n=1 Tax=Sphingomonas bacterium TaxID=1895847 RepID=UPI001576B121|nr:glycosyltransferase [Sphingomonas bacterium]